MNKINIGVDFSPDPSGRFCTDGDSSGEKFRENSLKPAINDLQEGASIEIILDDGVEGYGSSFLVEGFAGMVKHGYISSDELLKKMKFSYDDEDFEFYEKKIIDYVTQAVFDTEKYVPTTK